jgi:hypothetical protein
MQVTGEQPPGRWARGLYACVDMENRARIARHSRDPYTRMIGKLCLGGDWACANGNLGALGDIAERLITCSPAALHRELTGLSALCRHDPDRATAAWVQLKARVLRSVHAPP